MHSARVVASFFYYQVLLSDVEMSLHQSHYHYQNHCQGCTCTNPIAHVPPLELLIIVPMLFGSAVKTIYVLSYYFDIDIWETCNNGFVPFIWLVKFTKSVRWKMLELIHSIKKQNEGQYDNSRSLITT